MRTTMQLKRENQRLKREVEQLKREKAAYEANDRRNNILMRKFIADPIGAAKRFTEISQWKRRNGG